MFSFQALYKFVFEEPAQWNCPLYTFENSPTSEEYQEANFKIGLLCAMIDQLVVKAGMAAIELI